MASGSAGPSRHRPRRIVGSCAGARPSSSPGTTTPLGSSASSAVGDGVLAASIPLLEVLIEYQGVGVGTELVRRMLTELEGRYMVDLACDPELVPFYERLGLTRHYAMIRRSPEAIGGRAETGPDSISDQPSPKS